MLKKVLSIAAALCLAASVTLTGCGDNTAKESGASDSVSAGDSVAPAPETAKPVTLKWLLGGPGKQQDSEKVWAEFNKQLKEKLPNTEVEFEVIPFSEYAEKWKLIASAGDALDIAWSGWMLNYVDEIQKGAYLELDELIDKYAPDIKKELPEFVLDLAKYQGKIYSIPNYQQMQDGRRALIFPKELGEKYLNVEETQKVFASNETFTEANYAMIDSYLQKLKENNLIGKGVHEFFPLGGYYPVYGDFYIKWSDKNYKVVDMNESEEGKLYFSKIADWYTKGYVRKDVATDKTDYKGKKDGNILWDEQIVKDPEETLSARYGMEVGIVDHTNYWAISANQSATSTTITRTSANPERAMQLLDLMHTAKGKDLLNLLTYGLQDMHYKKVSENVVEPIGYVAIADTKSPYGLDNWVLGNIFNTFEQVTDAKGVRDFVINEIHAKAKVSPLAGFKVDTAPIQNEVVQVKAVRTEYRPLLNTGVLGNDWQKKHDEMMAKMKTAGVDKVKAELQKQVDEFLKAKGLK